MGSNQGKDRSINHKQKDNTMNTTETAIEEAGTVFQNYYLDWLNNFISSEAYAEHYGISLPETAKRINLGMKIHAHRTDHYLDHLNDFCLDYLNAK